MPPEALPTPADAQFGEDPQFDDHPHRIVDAMGWVFGIPERPSFGVDAQQICVSSETEQNWPSICLHFISVLKRSRQTQTL
jgi:hypothetical protein